MSIETSNYSRKNMQFVDVNQFYTIVLYCFTFQYFQPVHYVDCSCTARSRLQCGRALTNRPRQFVAVTLESVLKRVSARYSQGPLQLHSRISRKVNPQRRIRVLVLRLSPNWYPCRSQALGKFFSPRDAMQSAVLLYTSSPSVTLRYCDDLLLISSPIISTLCEPVSGVTTY